MSDSKNTLKDRFSDFEPEVTENAIEQNWQNLKGNLSLEKVNSKKRLFLFIGIGSAITIGVVVTLSMFLFNVNTPSQPSKNKSYTNIHNNKNTTEYNHSNKQHNTIINTQQNTHQISPEKSDSNKSTIEGILTPEKTERTQNSNLITNITKKQPISLYNPKNKSEVSHSINSRNNYDNSTEKNDNNTIGNLITVKKNTDNNIDSFQNESKIAANFNSHEKTINNTIISINDRDKQQNMITSGFLLANNIYNLPRDTNEYNIIYFPLLTNLIEDNDHKEKPYNKLSLEILLGSAFSKNTISSKLDDVTTTNKISNIGLSGSLGLNWQLSTKSAIHSQYIFNSNNFNTVNEQKNRIDIYKYTSNHYSSIDSSFVTDTITKHINFEKNYKIQSFVSHQYALGYSYKIIDLKKTFVDASLMFNVKQSKYNYEKNAQLSDTINYFSPTAVSIDTTTSYNTISYPPSEAKEFLYSVKNYSSLSVGLLPALTLGYKINDKTNLILRGSYYFDLFDNNIHNQDLILKIKQNSLFLHFGIRIKL